MSQATEGSSTTFSCCAVTLPQPAPASCAVRQVVPPLAPPVLASLQALGFAVLVGALVLASPQTGELGRCPAGACAIESSRLCEVEIWAFQRRAQPKCMPVCLHFHALKKT